MTYKKDCLTGLCPTPRERNTNTIKLSEGSGGREMQNLIESLRSRFPTQNSWKNTSDDGATLEWGTSGHIVFTTDSYVVTPIFFPGGNIGKIAFCGTVNDLSVMGAKPLGISLSLVLEEGFSKDDFFKIMDTISDLSQQTKIPIVTGDTKVLEKGSVDRIIINTSGIGIAQSVLSLPANEGDHIIVSGGIGEHGAALLAKRFELITDIETDSKPLHEEIAVIHNKIKQAKDITRGGLAAILNELSEKNDLGIEIEEKSIPLRSEVRALTEILGIDVYSLACEGRLVCIAAPEHSDDVVRVLRTFNPSAGKIGIMSGKKNVIVQTGYGKKILSMPSGNIVPRIC